MKKWLSILMALVMVLSMTSAVLAEEATPAETPAQAAQEEASASEEAPAAEEIPAEEEAPAVEETINKEETPQDEPDPEAVLLAEIQDALDPSRSVRLTARWDGDELFIGDEVRLKAELKGYDGVTYTLVWQYNLDPSDPENEWQTYTAGGANTITFTVDETNCGWYWRVLVNVTGLKG